MTVYRERVVLLFAGAAQTRGPFFLTMNTNDAIETAQAFPDAVIVPVHYEGWAHFKQSGDDLLKAFTVLGFGSRLRLLKPGVAFPPPGPCCNGHRIIIRSGAPLHQRAPDDCNHALRQSSGAL
jgi:hypothetical protein